MAQHSRFGGSAAERYLVCRGSVPLLATLPQPPSNLSDEGTWAHAIAAYCLTEKVRFAEKLLHTSLPFGVEVPEGYHGKIIDKETADAVQVFLDVVWTEMERHAGAKLFVEHRFELDLSGCTLGEVGGTCDALIYHPHSGRVVSIDYKHGVGQAVDAENNAQPKFYACGAVFSNPGWVVREVEVIIVQPRSWQADLDPVRRWTMPTYELLEFVGELEHAIAHVKRIESVGAWMPADFVAGPHCDKTFCDARGTGACPAWVGKATGALGKSYEEVLNTRAADLPDPKGLDTAELGRLMQALPIISTWLNQVQQYAEGVMLSGVQIPGFKVVEKIGRRKWVSADEDVASYAELMFGLEADVVRPRKLATLTEVEKQLKAAGATKEQLDDFMLKFTLKESSGRTIAPASDRRPAVDAIASDFGSVKLDA